MSETSLHMETWKLLQAFKRRDVVAFHVPNGEKRSRVIGAKLMKMGAVPGAPLPFGQSLLIAWPPIVGLIAATILIFVVGYLIFQRQEVRA